MIVIVIVVVIDTVRVIVISIYPTRSIHLFMCSLDIGAFQLPIQALTLLKATYFCHSPVEDWGDKVISWNTHPTHPTPPHHKLTLAKK